VSIYKYLLLKCGKLRFNVSSCFYTLLGFRDAGAKNNEHRIAWAPRWCQSDEEVRLFGTGAELVKHPG